MELFGTEYLVSIYFWTTFSFVVLLVIMWWKVVPALMSILDERAARIKSDLNEAQKQRMASEKTLAEYQKQLDLAKTEAAQILATARENAQAFVDNSTKELEVTLQRKAEDARKSIDQARNAALKDVQKEVADLTVSIAEKLLKSSVNTQVAKKLADDALKQIVN